MYKTTYHRAGSIDEAAALFAKGSDAKYLAGGHTLIPVMKQRLALGATVKTNKRSVAADSFFKGLFETALEDGELITQVAFPIPAKAGYSKFPHPASRFALTGVFVVKTKAGDVRVAATGASQSGVMRVAVIENALKANWSASALDSIKIPDSGLMSDI